MKELHLPEDTFKHQGMRKKLIDGIRQKGITDEVVLAALMKIPRHFFFDQAFLAQAYSDHAFQIGAGQTISQPYTVAYQTALLQVKKGDKVLEIGTGSGYQTCVLLEMGVKVFSIERQKELYDRACKMLPAMGYNAKLFYGDGFKGLPTFAPFDRILVTCGAPFIPDELVKQLKTGGRMVIPVGAGDIQVMTLIEKKSETEISKTEFNEFRFVPMLQNKEWGGSGNK
jgi:protein-L-isoaspartate(D-aspartate) O-methyltransferase